MVEQQGRVKGQDEYFCPECGALVKKAAVFCVHCGVSLRPPSRGELGAEGIAAIILTIFFPGTGQLMYGRTGMGITFLLLTILTFYVLWIVFMPISLALTVSHYVRSTDKGGKE